MPVAPEPSLFASFSRVDACEDSDSKDLTPPDRYVNEINAATTIRVRKDIISPFFPRERSEEAD